MAHRIATSIDELPDQGDILTRAGLAFMQDVVAGRLPGPPIDRTLGFWPVETAEDRVAFEGCPVFHAANPMRGVHGGWYGAILESCMSCAVMTRLPGGRITRRWNSR